MALLDELRLAASIGMLGLPFHGSTKFSKDVGWEFIASYLPRTKRWIQVLWLARFPKETIWKNTGTGPFRVCYYYSTDAGM